LVRSTAARRTGGAFRYADTRYNPRTVPTRLTVRSKCSAAWPSRSFLHDARHRRGATIAEDAGAHADARQQIHEFLAQHLERRSL
jgi:hypothetical protein